MTITDEAKAEIDRLVTAVKRWDDVAAQAEKLSTRAGALARVLARTSFADRIAEYEVNDKAAAEAQKSQKLHTRRAAFLGCAATLVAGLMLYFGLAPTESRWGMAFAAVYVACLAVAFWSTIVISYWRPYRAWAEARGRAETLRIGHFKAVIEADEKVSDQELPLKPLELEYVRAYLMEDQQAWFKRRAGDYDRQVKWNGMWRTFALGLIVISVIPVAAATVIHLSFLTAVPGLMPVANFINTLYGGQLLALGGVIGGSLQALISTLAATSLAERNAAKYKRMTEVLGAFLGAPLTAAREAAVNGDERQLVRFWTQVSYELTGENREWNAALDVAHLLTLEKLSFAIPHKA